MPQHNAPCIYAPVAHLRAVHRHCQQLRVAHRDRTTRLEWQAATSYVDRDVFKQAWVGTPGAHPGQLMPQVLHCLRHEPVGVQQGRVGVRGFVDSSGTSRAALL